MMAGRKKKRENPQGDDSENSYEFFKVNFIII
jgi:hypothetical protein